MCDSSATMAKIAAAGLSSSSSSSPSVRGAPSAAPALAPSAALSLGPRLVFLDVMERDDPVPESASLDAIFARSIHSAFSHGENAPGEKVIAENVVRVPVGAVMRDCISGSLPAHSATAEALRAAAKLSARARGEDDAAIAAYDCAGPNGEFSLPRGESIAVLCKSGVRARVAADALAGAALDAHAVGHGYLGLENPASGSFGFASLVKSEIGAETAETVGIALALANAGAQRDRVRSSCVIFMGAAVGALAAGGRGGLLPDFASSAPFAAKGMLEKLLSNGGSIFACKSCLVKRNIDPKSLAGAVHVIQAPDTERIISSADGSASF